VARGIAGLVVANSSLLVAVLIYMGWAYDSALYGTFHLDPLDLGLGPLDYTLRSLDLFSPDIVIAAAVLIAIMSVRAWGGPGVIIAALARAPAVSACRRLLSVSSAVGPGAADPTPTVLREETIREQQPGQLASRPRPAALLGSTGALLMVLALGLYWEATRVRISTFLVLSLLGAGPLLLTWPARAGHRGRGPYALAIVVAAVCALWAASVYAEQQGTQAAQNLVRDLSAHTAVVIYSNQDLALRGPGVSVQRLPPGSPYRYEYTGLRLLIMQSGTYYLLPANWTSRLSFTYLVDESDQTRIELY
jgi:hypothetical protein